MNMNTIPERIRKYIEHHTRPNSKMRRDLIAFIEKIISGEKVRYNDVKRLSIKYHIDRMKRLNLLVTIRVNGFSYIAINPSIIEKC